MARVRNSRRIFILKAKFAKKTRRETTEGEGPLCELPGTADSIRWERIRAISENRGALHQRADARSAQVIAASLAGLPD
jgi:hypothetical protein